jgi:putative salt-induced outer membrane protein
MPAPWRSLALLMLCAPLAALADDAPPPPPQGVWTGKGQIGFVAAQGNTEAQTANAVLDLALALDPWAHSFHLEALYGQTSGIVTAERWRVRWQSDYEFTKSTYTFGALRYEHDLFSGFEYQASATAGVGYKFFDTDTLKLSAQVGAGYRNERPEEITKDEAGEVTARTLEPTNNNAIATAGVDYSQTLTSTTSISNKFLLEAGASDTLLSDTIALTVKVSTKLALSVAYNIQDNTKPPPGLKSIDSTETVNLVYSL